MKASLSQLLTTIYDRGDVDEINDDDDDDDDDDVGRSLLCRKYDDEEPIATVEMGRCPVVFQLSHHLAYCAPREQRPACRRQFQAC